MPPVASGRIVKTTKRKKGTETLKNHRWESFTTKIGKLNTLDPIRRVRRHDLDSEDVSTATSYLNAGLQKWSDLTINQEFVEFVRDVSPLCDNLPQILHFEDQIMDRLATYIEKKNKDTLEALLELLTDFAHDLGVRFEKHFGRALSLITTIASSSPEIEVIEWSFGCLAFLFKYLSRLLVTDLRSTYDILSPLLGKARHSPHIARFTAEALSFLVRKAGAPSQKEKGLPTIVKHVRKDFLETVEEKQFGLYYHGVMTMFAEAAKGTGNGIHSAGPAIVQALLNAVDDEDVIGEKFSAWTDVISGVLTSLVHHSTPETFQEIAQCVGENANASVITFESSPSRSTLRRTVFATKIVGVITGVRAGSRISDWPALLSTLSRILKAFTSKSGFVGENGQDSYLWSHVMLTAGIALQYAPMDAAISKISLIMDNLIKDPFAQWFLVFCAYIGQSSSEKFRSFVLPYFQRFVIAHWSDDANGNTLCILIPQLVSLGVLPLHSSAKEGFSIPQSWQDQIVSKFESLERNPFPERGSSAAYDRDPKAWHDQCLPKYHGLLDVLECTNVHPSTTARISEILLRKLKLALRPSSALATDEAYFIAGKGFNAYSQMTIQSGKVDQSLRPLLHAAAPRYCRLPSFLRAMLSYERRLKSAAGGKPASKREDESDADLDLLTKSLIENLSSQSKDIRLLSLELLQLLNRDTSTIVEEVLSLMLMIEETPLTLESARSASMHIRKLSLMHKQVSSESPISRAVPSFLFGLLNVKFAQIWDDASTALKVVAETKHGEEFVSELAFSWLEVPSVVSDPSAKFIADDRQNGLTDFECTNLTRCSKLATETENRFTDAQEAMLERFELSHRLVSEKPDAARSQALRVFSNVPHIAEKHSRRLVPMFLSWAAGEATSDENDEGSGISDWNRRDQKALLDLFGKFVNPRVLFKTSEVHTALYRLLTNGDVEIQRSALKAVFTWKDAGIKPYEDNLLNILDETRFKDEVTILLQGDSAIQDHHRSEVMPVLLRLLYGRVVARGKSGMEGRRLMVLRGLETPDLGGFLDIALGKLKGINLVQNGQLRSSAFSEELLTVRKQNGLVHMMEDFLKETATKVIPFVSTLLDAVLYCLISAARSLRAQDDDNEGEAESKDLSLQKVIRQTGLRCLILLFSNAQQFDWSPYVPIILTEVVNPRLEKLPIENAQSVSGTLQLLSTWASSAQTVLFLSQNPVIIERVSACLAVPKAKEPVKIFVLELIDNLVRLARDDSHGEVSSRVKTLLNANMDAMLTCISQVLRASEDVSKDLLEACVSTVSNLATVVSGTSEARNLIDVAVYLLDQPSRRVSPRAKSGLLGVLEHFVPLYNLQSDTELKDKIYNTVTSLFGFFKDRASREVLSRVLLVYSREDPVMSEVAELCMDLNSFSDTKLDEPDYDRRLRAFVSVNKKRDTPFTAHQWRPLLFNALFYIKHDEEFGILSSNSSDTMRNFLDNACLQSQFDKTFEDMVTKILMPAVLSGVREPSEVVRREIVRVMSHVVKTFPVLAEVGDLKGLLVEEDELESSFFNNILAAGKGRRSAALSQVVNAAEAGQISSRNVGHFFVPLFEHFIFDRGEGNDAHGLAAEATNAIAALSLSLEWPQYRAILRRYIGFISAKAELEKQIIRLVGKFIDALAQRMETDKDESAMEVDRAPEDSPRLIKSLPAQAKLSDDVTSNILPPLTGYLHEKDESTVSLRVPVAVIIVRLLKLLPEEKMNERLPGVLTDLCHILRSKAQESREMTRDTLIKICTLLGPSHFGFVLKELRGALARGYQLHVLSYTMHAILVATTPIFKPGDLDYCIPSIVAVIMDDIFGATGQEKDAEEYTSKMKEVKSSKSHDSMELVASRTTLGRLTELVRPLRSLLKEKLDVKMVRKIDELLSRISTGLLKNPAAESRDSLIFCYEVIHEVYNQDKAPEPTREDLKAKRYLLQKSAKKNENRGATTVYIHKLVRFAFDVLRTLVKRYDNLCSGANLSGFIPLIGDAVLQAQEEVKIAALKLLATISRVTFKDEKRVTDLYKIATAESINCITHSPTISTDIAQTAFKVISVVLRDHGEVPIKDSSIDKLLAKMKDDITNPDTRHITFTFIRSILDAKLETAGVYDTLDYVGTVMVTNEDRATRDLARGAYFQFLRVYPQTQRRWSKQLAFVVSNLKYDREGGRLSILEVIRLLLSKSSSEFVQEVAATCFVPLIMVLANDESEQCRSTAGEVLKEMFAKADRERLKTFLDLLRTWVSHMDKPSVLRLGLQAYGFYYSSEATQNDTDVVMLRTAITETISALEDNEVEWEVLYAALQLGNVLSTRFPDKLFTAEAESFWANAKRCLSYPHAWVKLSASKLYGAYLRSYGQENAQAESYRLPLKGPRMLKLKGDEVVELLNRSLRTFKTPSLSEDLANQTVQNLVFLSKCSADSKLKWASHVSKITDGDESDDEVESEGKTTLQVIFQRVSSILRRETRPPRAPALIPKTAAMQFLRQLCNSLSAEILGEYLQPILEPLQNLTDPSIPTPYSTDDLFKANYEALKTSAQGLMTSLQNKCGTAKYTAALLSVREGVKSRRDQRTQKRKVEAITAPEKHTREKLRKVERKKERRKEKGMAHRDQRRGY